MLSKLWKFIKTRQSEIVLTISVILVAVIAFESGRISALRRFDDSLEIKYAPTTITNSDPVQNPYPPAQKLDLRVMASKNSTLYHFLWCSGGQRIKEENKIIFSSEQEAQGRGYKLASNCQK